MEYLVFPFGKYKGEKLEDLPSTYIVLALEKFELPDELQEELTHIIFGRLRVYTTIRTHMNHKTWHFGNYDDWLMKMAMNYEPTPF